VITQLEEAARTSMQSLEKVFDRANLDLDRILNETKRDYTGSGGPFEPISGIDTGTDEDDEIRVAALMTDLERVNLMRVAADRLPFGKPVVGVRQTSGFGVRRDPFRRRSSMHSGVDFAGPRGTPIFSTAGGVVTFAGRQSGYGITVKIRHAFGFETVYAHLNRAHVKVGQYVERGERIADMGSTGRSTGSHLHYEVRINKEPVNPAKFIEAARDVL
ncbi:MAG: peptidoglycan DD-metalloendopeptidase family protein, partial [Pseudomonadota bacterium]